ncbi:MAG: class A beta-lactamase-related serine hydrolase [Clostridia bacterium]|nr:class A beta-lactamase-related serine hydrolase [Clostridia bacterium]
MPVGTLKNQFYACAMPLLGKKPAWKAGSPISHILRGANVVGGSVCALYPDGRTETECVGEARLYPSSVPVHADTVFRTASIAKFATALLVLRLQTLGKLSVYEDISEALGYLVRNPLYQDQPITPYHLLSHTSGMTDTPAYFSSFSQPSALHTLLSDGALYAPNVPGRRLIYSNLAAGILGAWLEGKFGAR